jgi:hypothetical protein
MNGYTNIQLAQQRQADLWATADRVHAAKAARATRAARSDASPTSIAAATDGHRWAWWRRPGSLRSRQPQPQPTRSFTPVDCAPHTSGCADAA